MLLLAGEAENEQEAQEKLENLLASGQAIARLRDLVRAQGGDTASIEDPTLLPQASIAHTVASPREGYVSQLNPMEVGLTAVDLGAGRKKKGEPVDHAVGVVLNKKIGERVRTGETLCTIHAQSQEALERAEARLLGAYSWQGEPVDFSPSAYRIVR